MNHEIAVTANPRPEESLDLNATFDSLMQQALAASRCDDVEAALAAWRSAAALDPSSALPHFLMGAECAQAQRLGEAEAAFANAVLLAPAFETARYQLGLLQFTSGRVAVAHVTWEPLFRLPESSPIRRFVFGFAALARDDFDEALAHFHAGIALNHANPPMSADIRQVIAAIHQLRTPGDGAGTSSQPPSGSPDDEHVLLAGYRQGPLQ